MFILDSLLIGGIRWAIDKAITAAEAEMNDDTALREALLEAEMRREMGEISEEDFAAIESDLLTRIREIKERREGASGPLAFGAGQPMETSDSRFEVEASITGDFYDPADAPHTTVVEHDPGEGIVVSVENDAVTRVLDVQPGDADAEDAAALPLTRRRSGRSARSDRSRSTRSVAASPATKNTTGTPRTPRTIRTTRTAPTRRTKS